YFLQKAIITIYKIYIKFIIASGFS
ncbi:uncharacterized protein METZ01_LOCUS172019, partial [marine metagenome]